MTRPLVRGCLAALLCTSVLLAGCGGKPSLPPATSPVTTDDALDPVMELVGRVFLPAVEGATVSAYAMTPGGLAGDRITSAITGPTGRFALAFQEAPSQPLWIEARGGHYAWNGTQRTLSDPFALTAAWLPESSPWVSLTGFSHMAAQRARSLASDGAPLEVAIDSSNTGVASLYLLESPVATDPAPRLDDAQALPTLAELRLEVLTGALGEAAKALQTDPATLSMSLGRDARDGILDGMDDGQAVDLSMIQPEPEGSTMTAMGTRLEFQAPARKLEPTAGRQFLANGVQVFRQTPGYQSTPAFDIVVDPIPFGVNGEASLYGGTSVLPAWTAGEQSQQTLVAQGGVPPYGCLALTALPAGFAISANCVLSGRPPLLASGTSMQLTPPFRIQISDTAGATQVLTLQVTILAKRPAINTLNSVCTIGADGYAQADACVPQRIAAVPNPEPGQRYHYKHDSLRWGFPPFGLSMFTDGLLHGKTRQVGVFTFRVCAVDLVGANACGDVTVTVRRESDPTPPPTGTSDDPGPSGSPDPVGTYEGPVRGDLGTHANPYGCQWKVTYDGRIVRLPAASEAATFLRVEIHANVQWTVLESGDAIECNDFAESVVATGELAKEAQAYAGTVTNEYYCLELALELSPYGDGYKAVAHGRACLWEQDDQSDFEYVDVDFSSTLRPK